MRKTKKKKKRMFVAMTLRLPDKIYKMIDERADEVGVTKSSVIINILHEALKKTELKDESNLNSDIEIADS